MKTKNKTYWQKRALQREQEASERGIALIEEMFRQYQRAAKEIRKTVDSFILRYGRKHGMTYNEAAQVLNRKEMQEWKKTLQEYLAEINAQTDNVTKKRMRARLDALSANSSITRLHVLLAEVDGTLNRLYSEGAELLRKEFGEGFQEGYYKKIYDIQCRAGYISDFSRIDADTVEEILSYPWSGANFSERIWDNKDKLARNLRDTLVDGFIRGVSPVELAKGLSDDMGKGFKTAEKLIRTECSWLHGEADRRAYNAAGVKRYEFMATLDGDTCKTCGALDGKDFAVEEAEVGVNYPPLHPFDRCTTIESDPDDELDWFNSGKKMPEGMTYEEWYEEMVKRGEKPVDREPKRAYNKTKDEEQLARYTAVLGKYAPKDLAEFQNIKQNQPEYYKFLKLDYTRQNALRNDPEKALPKAEEATAAEAKFTKYLFNPENKKGYAKGQNFQNRLGYGPENWEELREEILSKTALYPATKKNEDQYGARYEQKMVLYGKKGTPANVIVGWNCDADGTRLTSTYIKEAEKNEN